MEVHFFNKRVEQFVEGLEKALIAKVLRTIELLEVFGARLGMPHSGAIGGGLFELRIHGKREVRLIYAFRGDAAVILHGFIKKTRKITQDDLQIAIIRKKWLDSL